MFCRYIKICISRKIWKAKNSRNSKNLLHTYYPFFWKKFRENNVITTTWWSMMSMKVNFNFFHTVIFTLMILAIKQLKLVTLNPKWRLPSEFTTMSQHSRLHSRSGSNRSQRFPDPGPIRDRTPQPTPVPVLNTRMKNLSQFSFRYSVTKSQFSVLSNVSILRPLYRFYVKLLLVAVILMNQQGSEFGLWKTFSPLKMQKCAKIKFGNL